jgi:hypothetical protein
MLRRNGISKSRDGTNAVLLLLFDPCAAPLLDMIGCLATGPAIFLDEHGYERFRGGYRWIYEAEVNGT